VKDDTEKSRYQTVPALSRTYCDLKKSYIITDGLGGVGLELSQWLIDRGAKTLVLTSRSGIKTGYQARKLKKWRRKGIRVEISSLDIVDNSTTYQLVKKANAIGPVGGVFHLAMVKRILCF
jgi:fatty acid synthase